MTIPIGNQIGYNNMDNINSINNINNNVNNKNNNKDTTNASSKDTTNADSDNAKCPFKLKNLENNNIKEDKITGCPFLNSQRPLPTRYGQGCQQDVCHTATMDKATGPWS
eukprot:Pgem_evm1s14878